jgi:enoyl-CoA hydratase
VYCRRWGVPLVDGGTVRLPRIVGMGRAMEIILTGRKVPAEEALRIGACEHVVPDGESRALRRGHGARDRPLSAGLRARRPALGLHAARLPLREAMRKEWYNGFPAFEIDGAAGAARFASGKGRHGDFADI